MNNEEEKAIDRLKKDTEKPLSCGDITIVIIDDINAVLNLIEKQAKEIEDKKEEIEYWKEQAQGYSGLAKQIQEDFENRDRRE